MNEPEPTDEAPAPTFPPDAPEVHPSAAKIAMGHAVDRAAEVLVAGGHGHLVEDLRLKLAALDRAWYEQSMYKQGQIETALGDTAHGPWPKTVERVEVHARVSTRARFAVEAMVELDLACSETRLAELGLTGRG